MSTPPRRQPVRVARGPYASLMQSLGDLLDGEVCYAEDHRALYVAEERGGRMELNAVRTTTQPSLPPLLQFHGLVDLGSPATGAASVPLHGDVVVVRYGQAVHSSWKILPRPSGAVPAGTQLMWDDQAKAWVNLGPVAGMPPWLIDLDQLPPLP